jgi:hypothetical protein
VESHVHPTLDTRSESWVTVESRLWIVAESDYSIAHSYKPMHSYPHRRLLLCPSLIRLLYRNFTYHFRQSEVLATVLRLSLTFALGCSRRNRLWRLRCPYTMTTKKLERVCTADAPLFGFSPLDTRLIMIVSIWFVIDME